MNIKNRTQLYFDSFVNDNELINEIFNVNPDKYVFRHHDCPIVFVTDGNKLYAMDMDEQGIDPIEKYGYDQIEACYNDYNEFLNDINKIEHKLSRILELTTWNKFAVIKDFIPIDEFMKNNEWFLRLVEERNELQKKIVSLETYRNSEHFETLSAHQQDLLDMQFNTMVLYFGILVQRENLIIDENKIKVENKIKIEE